MRVLLAIIIAFMVFPIAEAVLIQDLQTSVTPNSATLTWTTNQPANSTINYADDLLKDQTITDTSFLTEHSLIITGLNDDTTYYYDVIVVTQEGSQGIKPDQSFKTSDITPPPKVSGFESGEITRTSIELKWETVGVSDFKTYLVYKGGINIANTTSWEYTDENLESGCWR